MLPTIDKDKLKKALYKGVNEDTQQSISTIETVMDFVMRDAVSQFQKLNQVELSGFGKFTFSQYRGKNKVKKLTDILNAYNNQLTNTPPEDTTRINFLNRKIASVQSDIDKLKPKCHE